MTCIAGSLNTIGNVAIINDRIDLSGQIFGTFSMADVPNLVPAETNAELTKLLKNDTRKVIITKIFEFQRVEEPLNLRDNIIVMVDEAPSSWIPATTRPMNTSSGGAPGTKKPRCWTISATRRIRCRS